MFTSKPRNFVAKYSKLINRAVVMRNRKKDASKVRGIKHKNVI